MRKELFHENGQPMGALSVTSKRLIEGKPLHIVLNNPPDAYDSIKDEQDHFYEMYFPIIGSFVRDDWHRSEVNREIRKVLDSITLPYQPQDVDQKDDATTEHVSVWAIGFNAARVQLQEKLDALSERYPLTEGEGK